ncbi:hypothetical protein EDD80_1141 [Anseongella ginsenosidimutans]|uniref:Uncharacterized protein n=1 Tax=Anseongella ginsenosidimutans TaxID=496056 RepID=A0A4R3KMP0_9SPHI|nr:hypothetical protein EDD80_1141 [Anseongella ginsenosidimutans]
MRGPDRSDCASPAAVGRWQWAVGLVGLAGQGLAGERRRRGVGRWQWAVGMVGLAGQGLAG